MTANVLDGPSRLLTYLGTGNREKMLLQQPTCGPDNVLGCCQAGCSVTGSTSTTSYAASSCTTTGNFSCSGGNLTFSRSESAACSGAFACGPLDAQVTLDFDCGAAGDPLPMTSHLTCDSNGICSTNTRFSGNAEFDVTALSPTLPQERLYGIWSYGKADSRLFDDAAGARDFDANRFTDVTFTGCADVPGTSCKLVDVTPARMTRASLTDMFSLSCKGGVTKCSAGHEDPGFMYLYGTCPAETCAEATWTDERTGSSAGVSSSCLQWNGFRPTGASGGTDPCTSSTGTPTSMRYLSDAFSGVQREGCGSLGSDELELFRVGHVEAAFAPPQTASPRIVVNAEGQVSYGTLAIDTGKPAEKTTTGVRSSVGEYIYRLEVDRALHTCRHVDPTTCE
jgi:hypothetical protein